MSRRQVGQPLLPAPTTQGDRQRAWKQWPHGVLMVPVPKRDMGGPQQMLHSTMLLVVLLLMVGMEGAAAWTWEEPPSGKPARALAASCAKGEGPGAWCKTVRGQGLVETKGPLAGGT